ncbi:MAG: Ca-activated chloride channel, partial [Bacteroidota bacterium]|nr:Ca-activated chloride channel [Bacteroidota bacterium]
RDGNKLFKEKKYNDAEIKYRKSLQKNQDNYKANFNLGDALYKQNQYDKATEQFEGIANQNKDKKARADALHNLGNSYLAAKKYDQAFNAYKESLINNPKDMDTKYNLEYSRRMVQQQQQQQQNKDKNENKDQQQQQQQQQNKDDKNKDKQQQQQQQQKISKEDAERILQALNNEEKKVQKNKQKMVKGVRGKFEKQW